LAKNISSSEIISSQLVMENLTPKQLEESLSKIVEKELYLSTMIWGAPGIGKSSIVASVAKNTGLNLVDLRLSQLAPTDLRGLPVADKGISKWFPPEFLPTQGKGILFLDEINMAPPTMQGISQQLILDRKVGSYIVPKGWFIWAAGNRLEDRASVFEMPAPLSNRFIHYAMSPDFEAFKQFALKNGIHESIISFLAFRPVLLHKMDEKRPAWPSPRSWFMASKLHEAGMAIHPAIGEPAATEFYAYLDIYLKLPDLNAICAGALTANFPSEPSVRFAVSIGLVLRAKNEKTMRNALLWVVSSAPAEWQSSFVMEMIQHARENGNIATLAKIVREEKALSSQITQFRNLLLQ
jgi:MoxR-like ATPase